MTQLRLSRGKVTILVCVLVAAYCMYTAAARELRAQSVDRQLVAAEDQLAVLEEKKAYLEAVKQYAASDTYVEQEARRRLGYIREGEIPFVVTSPSLQEPSQTSGDWWERLFPR